MQCRFFHPGSDSISAGPVLTMPLFFTLSASQWFPRPVPQEKYSSNAQQLPREGTSRWDPQQDLPTPSHVRLAKPLDAMIPPLCLDLPGVCLPGVLSLPPSLSPPAQTRGPVLGRTCSQGAAPARVGSDRATGHLFCFCKQPGNICSVPAGAEETQPRGQCGLSWWRQLCLERWGHPHLKSLPRFQAKSLSWVCAFVIPVVIIFASREEFGSVS